MISALVPLTDWTPNPPYTQHLQQFTPPPGYPEIVCTESDTIVTTLQSELFSPHIKVFSGGDVNQVSISQPSPGDKIVLLFPDYAQKLSTDYLSMIAAF